jgi:hypothetical protein
VPVAVGVTLAVPLEACDPLHAPPVAGFIEAVQGVGGVLVLTASLNTVP